MRLSNRLALALVLLVAVLTPLAFTQLAQASAEDDRLAVSVVGDGSTAGNTTVPVTLRLIDGEGGLLDHIAFPTESDGDQHAFTLGFDRDQQGAVQQSADRESVTIGGYDAEPGVNDINGTPAPEVLRVVGDVDADGNVDTSTSLAGAFSERHIRGAVTDSGDRFWVGGHGGDSAEEFGAGVLTVERGGDTPTRIATGSGQLNNSRVPGIHAGQLYVSSDRADYDGVNQVGTGLPTDQGAAQTLIAGAPSGLGIAHDFAFTGDELYVAYTDGTGGLAKYRNEGGSWEFVDSVAGPYWGLTARPAGDGAVIYAVKGAGPDNEVVRLLDNGGDDAFAADETTIDRAGAGYAFRGIDFAPGFTPGDDPVQPGEPVPDIDWDVRVAGGTGPALGAVHGADTNPIATGTVTDPEGESVSLSVASSAPDVVTDDDIDVSVASDGSFVLDADSSGPGSAQIILTAETDDGRVTTSRLDYRVSDPLPDDRAFAHHGMSDASAAYDAGDGHRFVADDDSNEIRLFGPTFGEAVAEFDFSGDVTPVQAGQAWDLEGAARMGDTIYWHGSLGNTRSGNVRLDRDIVLATTVTGRGADAQLEFAGYTRGIRDALVEWDREDGHGHGADAFGFAAATQDGVSAEGPNALNAEGAAIAPDDTTLWLGMRSPLTPIPDGDQALIVEVENIADVVAGAEAEIGQVIELDLGGRAIRDMKRTDDGDYLIIAGSADDEGNFAIFGWDGVRGSEPVQAEQLPVLEGWDGSYESSGDVPSLADGVEIWLIQDVGTVDIYGDGTEAQDLPAAEFRKFPSHPYTLDFAGEFGVVDDDEDSAAIEPPDPDSVGTEGEAVTAGHLPRTGALIGFWLLVFALVALGAGKASLRLARRY